MLGTQFAELLDHAPDGLDAALDLVSGFDDGLVHGFARLSEERAAALSAMAGALALSPLGGPVSEAAEKVAAGGAADQHLAALAGGRAALLGAVHDALLAGLDTALGRARAPWRGLSSEAVPATPASLSPAPGTEHLLSGCRSWLHELAVTGWRGVDHDLVSTGSQVLQAILADPELRRLAVLLDGFAAELRASCPVGTMERLPVRRWADLWARALLLARTGGWASGHGPAELVSGRLLVLGVDVHEHGTAVQAQVHAILEPFGGDPPRLVRASVGAAKVDTIVGPAVWQLLRAYPVLLGALAEHRSLNVAGLPLRASGDLVWHDDRAQLGAAADPFAVARLQLPGALASAVPPLDRHPVRIAEPVLVEGYPATIDDGCGSVTLDLGGRPLTVDIDRLPTCGPLTAERVAASSACLGLIRWDGGAWHLQPLAVQTTIKRKPVALHNGDWALGPTDPGVARATAKSGDVVEVLRERAGRLLRR